jgi:hypothetical protein
MKLFSYFDSLEMRERAGEIYKPGSHAESMIFFMDECEHCIHRDDECKCLTHHLSESIEAGDNLYPIELQIGDDGQPLCKRKSYVPLRECSCKNPVFELTVPVYRTIEEKAIIDKNKHLHSKFFCAICGGVRSKKFNGRNEDSDGCILFRLAELGVAYE